MKGAKNIEKKCYGYGDYEELSQAGADFIAKDLDELENLLNTKK